MEIYSNTTRFALACNQSTKVIEPIQSRCAIVRFGRLSDQEILSRIMYVCQQEKVGCNECLAAHVALCTHTRSSKKSRTQVGQLLGLQLQPVSAQVT